MDLVGKLYLEHYLYLYLELCLYIIYIDPGVQPDHQDAVVAGDQGDAAGGRRGQVREVQLHHTLHTL